jgi:excisionase family DNA binding protein
MSCFTLSTAQIASLRRPYKARDNFIDDVLKPIVKKWRWKVANRTVTPAPPAGEILKVSTQVKSPTTRASNFAGSDCWWTVQQVAAYIQVHKESVLRWVRKGTIPHIILPGAGKDYRFQRDVIDQWGKTRTLGKQK